jgi:uncharacterized protein
MRERILKKLEQLERERNIQICLAIESGSRAWGFASLNSDYDVRFIYKRKIEDYLSFHYPKDVVNVPIVDPLDFHGWDLYKACRLLLKSNATVLEWLNSPIVYIENGDLATGLKQWAEKHVSVKRMVYHYLHMANKHFIQMIKGREQVKCKVYLYSLRPLFCIKWLEQKQTPPPTSVWELLAGIEVDKETQERFACLVHLKQRKEETAWIPTDSWWNQYIEQNIARVQKEVKLLPDRRVTSEGLEAVIFRELGICS